MKHMIIDGISCEFENERNVLEVAKKHHIDIPNLCYCESLSIYGGCRLCVVENERGAVEAACSMQPKDGLVIKTNTARLRKHRQMILELLLAGHRAECTTCEKSGKCKLQTYARRYNVTNIRFANEYCKLPIDDSSPSIVRDPSKCILCGKCVRMCSEIQNIHAVDFAERGIETYISCGFDNRLADTKCVGCGQCAAVCPTGAIVVKNEISKLWAAIYDSTKKVAVQVAPAVRVGIGEEFGMSASQPVMGKIVTALKMLGADYVFDTSLTADLTIMEESAEFMNKLKTGAKLPMFTSCCPGWVRFVKSQYPELTGNLSTAKSPQQMLGAVAKSYFAEKAGIDAKRLFVVSIMPCVAKKSECELPTMKNDAGDPEVDVSITTRELNIMMRANHIEPKYLPEEEFDSPLGSATGAAVVFGATGGVMDAALRSAYYLVTGENPDPDAFTAVRGMQGWKEASFDVPGAGTVRTAVVSGLGNTRKLMEAIASGHVQYDFVEVMACPGGCAGGGGQPIHDGEECAEARGNVLWRLDYKMPLRFSHENPDVQALYKEYLGKPLSERSHHLLHTDIEAWQMPQEL